MSKKKKGFNFDEMPTVKPPNPLPCGCGIFGVEGINWDGTKMEWRSMEIQFCPLHGASPFLLAACKTALARLENPLLDTSLFEDVKSALHDAIAKATA